MSRTYRRDMVQLKCCDKKYHRWEIGWWGAYKLIKKDVDPDDICHCTRKYDYFSRRNRKRDKILYTKRYRNQSCGLRLVIRKCRPRIRQEMYRENYDLLPGYKKLNIWDFYY